jgi:hypothetical protein
MTQEPSLFSFEELVRLLTEEEAPLLATLDVFLRQHEHECRKKGVSADKVLYVNRDLWSELRKELISIGELIVLPDGQLSWDGYRLVPTYFSQHAVMLLPSIQFLFFLNPVKRELQGV